MQERLQKILAHAGVSSRRAAEDLILAGRITVNGHRVTELGSKADPENDRICLDSKPLRQPRQLSYYLFNKPRGVMTTLRDPEGRPTIQAYLKGIPERVYPAGRLDYHSEGLLLLTNDGELAQQVMHARTKVPKVYWVKVSGRPTLEQLQKLRQGVYLDGRKTAPAGIRWQHTGHAERASGRRTSNENPWLEVTLTEGRKNQIRRMFLSVGHPVEKLKRVRIGSLELGRLAPGQLRPVTAQEVAKLKRDLREAEHDGPAAKSPGTGVRAQGASCQKSGSAGPRSVVKGSRQR